MNILLDECVDWRFGRLLTGHDVSAVFREGWMGMKNGALLTAAASKFEVLLTVDQNISYQQTVQNYDIALMIIEARSTRLSDLEGFVPDVLESLRDVEPGTVIRVGT